MQKKSELSEISDKSNLCYDPREARLEINSGRYDSYLERIVHIYFSNEYRNTNSLKIESSEIRKKFLENFEFRKSLIEFGQKKGLGKDNSQVRDAFRQIMNFEETNTEEIQTKYKEQIKALFFGEEETEGEDNIIEKDPILDILSDEDKIKVNLSKKYGGDIQTFSKLTTILELTDPVEQENILRYLLDINFEKDLKYIDIGKQNEKKNTSLDRFLKLIDIVQENSYKLISNMLPEHTTCGYNADNILILMSHILEKHKGETISSELLESILSNVKYNRFYRENEIHQNLKTLMKENIESFINSLTIKDEKIDEKVFKLLTDCFEYIYNEISDINITNPNIDFDIISNIYEQKAKRSSYEIRNAISNCKKSQQKNLATLQELSHQV